MDALTAYRLRCEHLAAVQGLNTATPRFSWALAGQGHGRTQSSYRLVLASSQNKARAGTGDIWDSGTVTSAVQTLVPYSGPDLAANQVLYWSVRVCDEAGRLSDWASPAVIHTGLPSSQWQGDWIARYFVLPAGRAVPQDTDYDNRFQARPADYLRREFDVIAPVRQAVLYISALGVYEAYLNGQRIGDAVMAPGWTDYHQRVEYQSFDVTDLLDAGENCLGAIIGEGWYCGRVGHNQRRAGNHYGGRPALNAQLMITHEDGTTTIVSTDAQWQTAQGAICYSDMLVGERYDARLERTGWNRCGHDTTGWQPVERFRPDPCPPLLEASRSEPVREVARLPLREIAKLADGTRIFDVGQNLTGYVELGVSAQPGDCFTLHHAEMLAADGSLYRDNLRFAVAEDIFVAAGHGTETFKPHFTFHGFRYVGLRGPKAADLSLTAIAIQTDSETTGGLETGNVMVNQLVSNIFWSQRGNFLSVPTDCPQRDERLGWSADAQVFWRTAGYFMDVSGFLAKWMEDIADAQLPDGAYTDIAPSRPLNPYRLSAQPGAPGWGDGPIIMGWAHYLRYGDRDLLASHYARFVAWMDHIEGANPDLLRVNAVYNNYGDWLSVGPATDRAVVATAYWAHIADLMARIAGVLTKRADARRFGDLFGRLRQRFAAEFVGANGIIRGDTQTAYLLALDFDLLAADQRPVAADHLQRTIAAAGGHLQTGFLGVKHLCPVLADTGDTVGAFDLLLNQSYPSWGFSIAQGATTIWERWDGWTPERGFQAKAMNSFNHYAYGSVGEWLFARIAGIDWDEADPGFATVRMRPLFDRRIGFSRAHYQSSRGRIETAWSIEGNTVSFSSSIPPNSRAVVALPVSPEGLSAEGEGEITAIPGGSQITCGSGRHVFTFQIDGGQFGPV